MATFKTLITAFFFVVFVINATSQSIDSIPKKQLLWYMFKDSTQKDANDVLGFIFKRKKEKKVDTLLPKKNLQIAYLPAIGYALQTGFAVVVTGNATFSTNRNNPNQKTSVIFTGITYSQQNQIIFPLLANIWTKNNRYNIISDNRYIQYPNYIFGIGNNNNPKSLYSTSFSFLRMHQSFLKDVGNNFYLGLGLMYDKLWNIKGFDSTYPIINPSSSKIITKEKATGIAIRALYDNRLNQINAKKGLFANIIFRQNTTLLGSDFNWGYLTTDIRGYIPFPKKSKNVLAIWSFNWLTFGGSNITNFLLPSNGWDDTHNTGRGYIQGRFRGRNLYSLEAEYRVALTKNGFLGATIFANAQHFNQEYFYKTTAIKPGGGIGLRVKLNKNSDANLCIDYGWGQNGSQGFFINVGEVF